MTDNAEARNEATNTTVIMQQVSNGAFTNVKTVQNGETIFSYTWISHLHFLAQLEFAKQCETHGAS